MGTATLNYVCGCVKLPVCDIKLSFGFLLLIQSTVNLFPRHTVSRDWLWFCGVCAFLLWSFCFAFVGSSNQGWVRVSCELECLIKAFVLPHTMSLSSLIHSLAMCQISDPLIDNHTFVCCQLGKLIPPPSDPSTTHHANHVQTGSQIPELFFNCYDNRAKILTISLCLHLLPLAYVPCL